MNNRGSKTDSKFTEIAGEDHRFAYQQHMGFINGFLLYMTPVKTEVFGYYGGMRHTSH